MAIDPTKVFNQVIPPTVKAELDRRKLLAAGATPDGTVRSTDFNKWNYKRYAYVSATSTGENSLDTICSQPNTIGDGTINTQVGLGLYETEGGIRRTLPILKSVTIDSDGSTDVTQATMWTGKVNFDVFTLDQLDKAEQSFLRIGTIVRLDFGWKDELDEHNSGFIEGAVTNYNFSANKDGSFSCNFEIVGANNLFSAERLDGSPADAEVAKERDDVLAPYPNIVDTIALQHKIAFNIESGGTYTDKQAADGKIVLKGNNNEFALANIQQPQGLLAKLAAGFGYDLNDMFIQYITLGGFIDRINTISKKSTKFKTIVCNGETTKGAFVAEMFSSDPTAILFGGDMANYGTAGDMLFGSVLDDFQTGDGVDLSKIRISIAALSKIYGDLKQFKESDAKESQTPPAVKDMLTKIFELIETHSGGLYQLVLYQAAYDDKNNIYVVNKRVGYDSGNSEDIYTFDVIGEQSILRDMSLSTEFNAELQAAATTANKTGGQSSEVPKELFDSLYKDCPQKSIPAEEVVSEDQLKVLKDSYAKGFEETMVQAASDSLRKYLVQNIKTLSSVKAEFKQMPYLINLSVTLDGIFGIPYFGRFTVDRLPATYRNDIYFGITKINHAFDGQGDWSTQIEGVMKIKMND